MRIAYLECFSGISGDMLLGALVDAGVPASVLEKTVAALGVGARLEISRVMRSGISATKVDVWVGGEKDLPREENWEKRHFRSHAHSEHEHSLPGEEPALRLPKDAPAPHVHGRGLTEIRRIISATAISQTAKATAISIFEALGRAEA